MKINNIMHIAFYTDNMDEMIKFYTEDLGGKIKVLTRYEAYKDRADRPYFQKLAIEDPKRIFNVYIELAPNQFIELFPKMPNQTKNEAEWNSQLGYTHFALTVDDIFEAKKELEEKGIKPFTEPSKGPSETWQCWFNDPDGNKFEVMQYTENSYQVKGHVED